MTLRRLMLALVIVLMVTPVFAIVGWVSWHYYRLHQGFENVELARTAIAPLGGTIGLGVRKGRFDVLLNDSNIDDEQFIELAGRLRRFPPPHLDQRHTIEIHARNTKISDKSIEALKGIPIQALDIHGTAVTDASIAVICDFPLWSLDISETNVTDASIPLLLQMAPMRLGVQGSKITADGIKVLEKKLPRTDVF